MEDAELDAQAQLMAEKALAALPEAARAEKIGKVKEGILKRLRDQAAKAAGVVVPSAGEDSSNGAGVAAAASAASRPAVVIPEPPPPPPPPEEKVARKVKLEGVEACGDEPWFADFELRKMLSDFVVAAHAEQKILVGSPADEIRRICPGGGRVLGAGAVLRLGGSTLGGFGEADIGYAYRQLSRALHPDKNPDIPEAPDAFKRLREASDELKEGLTQARAVIQTFCGVMGGFATLEMLERPQEALFAEATRLLSAVLALSGEGEVPPTALHRGMEAFDRSPLYPTCQPQVLSAEWWDGSRVLDHFAGPQVRTAYDCAPKRFRAQFLTLLNRCLIAEAKRNQECVRGNWQTVMEQFPEMNLWREFREKLNGMVTTPDVEIDLTFEDADSKRSKWDNKEPKQEFLSGWGKKWRKKIKLIFPRGTEEALPVTDPEVMQLGVAIWKEVAEWARSSGDPSLIRTLDIFTADPPGSRSYVARGVEAGDPPAAWAFVPASDLFQLIGEGLVGFTAEGGFADNSIGHERFTFEEVMSSDNPKKKKKEPVRERSRDRSRSRHKRDRSTSDRGGKRKKPSNDPDFDWEKEWRKRTNRTRRSSPAVETRRSRSRRERRRERRRAADSRSRSRQRTRRR